ncbi:MAG TPA: hypothetical protein VJM33_13050 [Microthrixaceae bacterium]|nr:hypothetical protein [Microthrixaceae bacterium]
MTRTARRAIVPLLIALVGITACTANPGVPSIPILSPWPGTTVNGLGTFANCSALGGPVRVSMMLDGTFYARVSSGSGVVSEGAVLSNTFYPPPFISHALAPGECFTLTVEISDAPFQHEASFTVWW